MTFAIIVVAALVLVPGLGAALAFAPPGAMAIEGRIALAFGLGYALVAAVATLLVLAHVFSLVTFVTGVVLGTGAVWALALRRASPREHVSVLRAEAREAPLVLAVGLAFLLAVAAARLLYPPGLSLAIRSSWRYWADGLEVAAAGHVPAETQQWGIEIPTTVSKVALNSFEGGISFLLGPEPLPAMHGILVVTALGLVAALLALGRELGLGIFAPLVPVLTVLVPGRMPLSDEISNDLRWYTAEDVGRMAAFGALIAGIYAVRAQDRWIPAVVTGVCLALAGLTHLVPVLVAGVMLAFFVLATFFRNWAELRRTLVTGAAIAVAFAVSYVGILAGSGGDLGFQRAAGGHFSGFPPSVDPTLSLARGAVVRGREQQGHFLVPPRALLRRYGEQLADRSDGANLGLVALAALAAASAALVFFVRSFLAVAAVAWGLAGTILAVAFLFSYRYQTVVPGDWGARRLYDYVVIVPALIVPAVLQAITRPFTRRSRVWVAAVAVGVGALAVGATVDRVPDDRTLTRAAAGIRAIERVADVVPCGARMLSNARTAGTWEAMTGRPALTEGMSPYLRPEVMARVLPVLIGANRFFRNPQANREFLARRNVEYLVIVDPHIWVGTNGERRPQEGDAEAVAALPNVHPVLRARRVSVFAVGSSSTAPGGGEPRRCPL
jgi:hypothetical protein